MVEISDRSFGYGFVSAAGVRQGARALADVGAAAGQRIDLTQANLRSQAANMQQLGNRVGQLAQAINGVEEARGVIRSQELSDSLQLATRRAVNRMLQAESLTNARRNGAQVGNNPDANIATAIANALRNDDVAGAAIARILSVSAGGGANAPKVTPLTILANAASSARKLGDIFDRQLPTKVEAFGRASVEVSRRALQAQADRVVLNADDPDAFIPTARVVDAGNPSPSNEVSSSAPGPATAAA